MDGHAAPLDDHAAPRLFDEPLAEAPAAPRMHAITLCCAHSVESMVEEVARNLRGLGFRTNVVCGGEARDVLMAGQRDRDEPLIYVVCVQGALKDTVLKPLRTALATHGGPNEHLFVAVLDLSLPLSMVGQIRRFAEAIERMPGAKLQARTDGLGERRQWREHIGPTQMNDVQTRTYRSLKVVEPEGADPRDPVAARAKRPPEPTGPRPIVSQRKPAKIKATRKYKAVTGPEPIGPPLAGLERAEPNFHRKGATVLYGEQPQVRRHRIQVPGIETKTVAEPSRRRRSAEMIGAAIITAPKRSRAPMFLLLGAVLAGAAFLAASGKAPEYFAAARARVVALVGGDVVASDDGGEAAVEEVAKEEVANEEVAKEEVANEEVAKEEVAKEEVAKEEVAEEEVAKEEVANEEVANEADAVPLPEEPTAVPSEAETVAKSAPTEDADVLVVEEEEEPVDDAGVDPEQALASAIASGKVRAIDRLYIVRGAGEPTSFTGALRRCRALEVDGVMGWRLPHRRELRLMGAIGILRGNYWSRATDGYDPAYALVYEANERRFATWAKSELGGRVVCVRTR